MQTRKCDLCSKEYERNTKYSDLAWSKAKYCSYKCATEIKKQKALLRKLNHIKDKKICRYCNTFFERNEKLSDSAWKLTKYCSSKCSGNANKKYKDKKEKAEIYLQKRRDLGQVKMSSVEFRDKISKSVLASMKNSSMGYPHIKRGYYDINGTTTFFRSKWEANYALYLDFLIKQKEIKSWEFEPDTFMFEAIKTGTRSYTPDFKIIENDDTITYHEVKGYMDSRSKTKIKRFKKYYPEYKFVLVDGDEYNTLKKQIGKLCKFYE